MERRIRIQILEKVVLAKGPIASVDIETDPVVATEEVEAYLSTMVSKALLECADTDVDGNRRFIATSATKLVYRMLKDNEEMDRVCDSVEFWCRQNYTHFIDHDSGLVEIADVVAAARSYTSASKLPNWLVREIVRRVVEEKLQS